MNDTERKEITRSNRITRMNAISGITALSIVMYIIFAISLVFSIFAFSNSINIAILSLFFGLLFFAIGKILNGIKYNRKILRELYIEIGSLK